MAESTLLSPKDVVITRTVAKFGNTSYQIAAISSVSAQHRESVNWNFVSTGLLLIIAVLVIGYFEWISWIQVGIAGGIIVVITIILSSVQQFSPLQVGKPRRLHRGISRVLSR
jgi:small neutral amino acid transporter SnatA (MarC family)